MIELPRNPGPPAHSAADWAALEARLAWHAHEAPRLESLQAALVRYGTIMVLIVMLVMLALTQNARLTHLEEVCAEVTTGVVQTRRQGAEALVRIRQTEVQLSRLDVILGLPTIDRESTP